VDFDASVRFLPWQPQAAFFGLLQRADAFLDTVGFSGFNTAMQAVECGTPMVAWEGNFLRGRFASGILRALGLEEWIATTHEAYADKVARLCADAALRKEVRAQIAARRGALYDDRASVQAFAEVLQRLA
jgi:predicted O-linked N-acetylglucosamine transferase (SPINDLY family)